MTTFTWSAPDAGRNPGIHPWRDSSSPNFVYHMRETTDDEQANIEAVIINVTTGTYVQMQTWAYADNLGTLGACFVDPDLINWDSNIAGSLTGDKLYLAASNTSATPPATYDSVIIEFDKATFAVTQHWPTGNNEDTSRDGSSTVLNGDGSLYARGADNFIDDFNVFEHSNIELLRPSNGDYGYVNISSSLSISTYVGFPVRAQTAIVFDSDDFLWFVGQPVATVGFTIYVTGPSSLYKCSITGSPTLSLVLVDTFPIADNYHAYGTSQFAATFGYLRMTYDYDTNKINLWSAWKDGIVQADYEEGWFLEWDVATETFTRGPLDWTPGVQATGARYDAIGWTNLDYLSVYARNSGVSTSAFSVFKISDATETAYLVETDWPTFTDEFSFALNLQTWFYSQQGNGSFEIYGTDWDSSSNPDPPPSLLYFDILFMGEEPPLATVSSGYFIERMDNRIWPTIEDAWCVDSGLRYPMPEPDAILTISSAAGDGAIRTYNIINGGSGYTAPIGQVFDLTGPGSGASVSLAISGGVIVTATASATGSGYLMPAELTVLDATGVGAVIQPIVTNYTTMSANAAVFEAGSVGDIVRAGGGKIEVVTYTSDQSVIGNVISPVTYVFPNDPDNTPIPLTSGEWTMTTPTMTVSGLAHLEGMGVVALADGGVVTGLTVEGGAVTLPVAATAITVGLPFVAQLQTMYLDLGGGPTVQTRRKDVTQVTLRVESSRAPEIGLNQPDAAAQPNQREIPWGVQTPGSSQTITAMTQIQFRMPEIPAGQPVPLYSGDYPLSSVFSTWDQRGQIAVQQRDPVPLGVSAIVGWVKAGDSTGQG